MSVAVIQRMCKSPQHLTEPRSEDMHIAIQTLQLQADASTVLLDRAALDEARDGPCSTGEKVRSRAQKAICYGIVNSGCPYLNKPASLRLLGSYHQSLV